MFSKSIRTCCSGNAGSREAVKEIIRTYLSRELGLNETKILLAVPFCEPDKMTAMQLAESMIYLLDKESDDRGFQKLCEAYHWGEEREDGNFVSEADVRNTWQQMAPVISYPDKLEILVRLLFADTVGLGAVDTLNWQQGFIEEIQLGMNGLTEQKYSYREELRGSGKRQSYSKDSVHVLLRGTTVWLKYITFGREGELQRVLRNLIKDSAAGELTRNSPMAVVDTLDGRRVSVSRPPMTDGWAGLIRKFDTLGEVSLTSLYAGETQGEELAGVIRALVQSGRNIAITGEMASGKTTLFRACLAEIRKEFNIRIIESESFELNVRQFLPQSNTLTMRITARTPVQDVLAFARKTTGQVFGIGEINSPLLANMAMDLSKIATQLLFSAHYLSTEDMIADFTNARLCAGGYTEEMLAEQEAVHALDFDIHLWFRNGKRSVQYINEILPAFAGTAPPNRGYRIRRLLEQDEAGEYHLLAQPTERGGS